MQYLFNRVAPIKNIVATITDEDDRKKTIVIDGSPELELHSIGYSTGFSHSNEARLEVTITGKLKLFDGSPLGLPKKAFTNRKKGKVYTTFLFGDEAIVVKKHADEEDSFETALLWGFFLGNSGLSKTQAKKFILGLKKDATKKKGGDGSKEL